MHACDAYQRLSSILFGLWWEVEWAVNLILHSLSLAICTLSVVFPPLHAVLIIGTISFEKLKNIFLLKSKKVEELQNRELSKTFNSIK